jgi:MFS family permease
MDAVRARPTGRRVPSDEQRRAYTRRPSGFRVLPGGCTRKRALGLRSSRRPRIRSPWRLAVATGSERALPSSAPSLCQPPVSRRPSVLRRDLWLITVDGLVFSAMVGLGETWIAAFVLAADLGAQNSGLVAVVPMVAGALLGLVSTRAVRWLGSRRLWVVLCAALQTLALFALAAAAYVGDTPAALAFALAAVYWAGGLATGPAWNAWIETRVPKRIRARYFGRRTRRTQAFVFLGLLAGGLFLHYLRPAGVGTWPYAVLFGGAGVLRAISVYLLWRTGEGPLLVVELAPLGVRRVIQHLAQASDARFLLYLLAMQVAVQLSGPYFTAYMLEELDLSYVTYMGLMGTAYLSRVAMSPHLGEYARRHGVWRLLWLGALGIVPTASLWIVSDSLPWLYATQLYTGMAWGALELAQALLLFEAIPRRERVAVLALFNLANATAQACGALVGGLILSKMGAQYSTYLMLFGLSSSLRLLCLCILVAARRREVPVPAAPEGLSSRIVAVRPTAGAVERPILASLETTPGAEAIGADNPTWEAGGERSSDPESEPR